MLDVQEELMRLCGGDRDALSLINGFWSQCETWDDLVDKDVDTSAAAVNQMMIWAMFELPANPVYRAHPTLALVLRLTVANWFAANALEKTKSREDVVTAYTLRCSPFDFFVAVVMCVSGPAAADEAALLLRTSRGEDRLDAYLSEHGV
jgi:hypothetical protein